MELYMHQSNIVKEVVEEIKKTKSKVLSSKDVSILVEKILGDDVNSIATSEVKEALKMSDDLDYFREGSCIHEDKFYWSAGNWFSLKGMYKNAVEAKSKIGIYSWQRFVDDNAPHLEI